MSEDDIEKSLADQKRTISLIEQLHTVTRGPTATSLTAADLEARCAMLEEYWHGFTVRDFVLQRSSGSLQGRTYFKNDGFAQTMNLYFAAKAWYSERIKTLRAADRQPTTSGGMAQGATTAFSQAVLEKLKLPHFDGHQREWESFKEKFTSLILNDTSMDSVIKFQHLLNCLEGEAAEKLRGIKLTGANFQTAWNTLCRRYDNKYLRFTVQMQAISRLPSANKESVAHINQLLNTVNESINSLRALDRPVDSWDDIFVYFVESKLAPTTRIDWAKEVERKNLTDFPSFKNIQTFLEDRIRTLDLVEIEQRSTDCSTPPFNKKQQKDARKPWHKKEAQHTDANVATQKQYKSRSSVKCSCCGASHFLNYCSKFSKFSLGERFAFVKSAKLCHNCLNAGHSIDSCQSQGRCLVCGEKHHTKLHRETKSLSEMPESTSIQSKSTLSTAPAANSAVCLSIASGQKVLLSTACVNLQGPNGNSIAVRALLDTGAEESFISEHVVQALNLRKIPVNVVVSGIGGAESVVSRGSVNIILKSRYSTEFSFKFSALVLKRLTTTIPKTEISSAGWPALDGLQLADPHFGKPGRIDCILNAEVYSAVLQPGIHRGLPGTCVALQSSLGWILMGAISTSHSTPTSTTAAYHITVDKELSDALTKFWEIEEVPFLECMTPDDEACYKHFKETHFRNSEGRFVVRLPFIQRPTLVDSRSIAECCFSRLEKRLQKNPDLLQAYSMFMDEYQSLHHMEVVSPNDINTNPSFYLPHHPVFKSDGSKKLRVVFNASQKRSDGNSLNSFLQVGPKLQEDVLAVLIRWSFCPYVFTCDIVKMFRQFLMHSADTDWQRILWRSSSEADIQVFRLLTVTYGTASAPFLANACLLQLANDEASKYPLGAKVLRNHRYADDFFVGGDSVAETIVVRDELLNILQSAGMQVGKWSANHDKILTCLGPVETKFVNFQDQTVVSTLGIGWNPVDDTFCFRFAHSDLPVRITKRTILSEIAKLYDPVGWLSPIIIRAKIILQNLWLQGVDWDDSVSPATAREWLSFRQELPDISSIRISRWFGSNHDSEWSIHGFSDASERAFAASIYIVVRTTTGNISKLISAKSKVSPIKVISLPRLELCGASLLVKLIRYLLSKLDCKPVSLNCWTDSTVVLSWLRAHPSRWKSFVANRVSDIITTLPEAVWRHVRSADNPADLATRGLSPNQLRDAKLWWKGPYWLEGPDSTWPLPQEISLQTTLEVRQSNAFVVGTASSSPEGLLSVFVKFSSFDKIVRIFAYIARWRLNASLSVNLRRHTWLSAKELTAGRQSVLRVVQNAAFFSDIQSIRSKGFVPPSSPLRRLSPFIDINGLLRVGGRLQNAFLTEDEKHPVILPSKNHISTLLIKRAHLLTLHGGPSLVHSYLMQQFWIIRGRNFIRSIVRQCVKCIRYKAKTLEQQMAPLPDVRTRPARPFTYTGVDYAGPFFIKASPGRGQKSYKGYVALFICLVVRAVHLEVVSDYTSAAFLAAFRRFTARRGLCQLIYSDNGTTFKGADSELRQLFNETSVFSQDVASLIAADGVEWTYIPPRAPNFGGLWEANIKSVKYHLKRVVGESKLTFEELSTVIAMIEGCLNSRPLSILNPSAEDISALTPGHFLIGASLSAPPEPFVDINCENSIASRWHLISLMRNHFWKRWTREYLMQLQQRSKWLHPRNDLQIGDIVLFKDELTPPGKWPLGRIVRLFPGKDGLNRVATIRTIHGEYKRPINKLIIVPVNDTATDFVSKVEPFMAGGK